MCIDLENHKLFDVQGLSEPLIYVNQDFFYYHFIKIAGTLLKHFSYRYLCFSFEGISIKQCIVFKCSLYLNIFMKLKLILISICIVLMLYVVNISVYICPLISHIECLPRW
jgi:hypothetical protein